MDSWAERRLAEKVAGGVIGVRDLRNRIDVEYEARRSDDEILEEVRRRLRWDALVDHGFIKVDVKDAKVRLTGAVGSAAERDSAHWDAWVAAVKDVDISGPEVKLWARDRFQRKATVRVSDGAIRDAVKDALLFDPRVNSSKIASPCGGPPQRAPPCPAWR